MNPQSIRILFSICFLVNLLHLVGCQKDPYGAVLDETEWIRSYIPVKHNGIQVGSIEMAQKVITDVDLNLDPKSIIVFKVQEGIDPIWRDSSAQLLLQVFDPSPGWEATITNEVVVNANINGMPDTLAELRNGFVRPFMPEQIRAEFLKCNNGSNFGGRYIGTASGLEAGLPPKFICTTNVVANSDGLIEIRFVDFPKIVGISGQVIEGTFSNGELLLPDTSLPLQIFHFPKDSLTAFYAKMDSGIADLMNVDKIFLSFSRR